MGLVFLLLSCVCGLYSETNYILTQQHTPYMIGGYTWVYTPVVTHPYQAIIPFFLFIAMICFLVAYGYYCGRKRYQVKK